MQKRCKFFQRAKMSTQASAGANGAPERVERDAESIRDGILPTMAAASRLGPSMTFVGDFGSP